MPSSLRLRHFAALAVLSVIIAASCVDGPASPDLRPGHLALAPAFQDGAAIVPIDEVRVVLRRPADGSVALDTTVNVVVGSQEIDLLLSLPISGFEETFLLTIECFTPDGTLAFQAGPLEVTATASTGDGIVAEEVPIDYVGPGSQAVAVQVLTQEASVKFGEIVSLLAEATDADGAVVPDAPIGWRSLNASRATVPERQVGEVRGESERGAAQIVAELVNGAEDTVVVLVEPVPSAISIVSGNTQTAQVGSALAAPLVVRVDAVDGPMAGAPVLFSTGDGGTLVPDSADSDTTGLVQTRWTLGPNPGTQSATATVPGVTGAQVTFTANAAGLAGGIQWASAADGNWSDPTNWDLGRVPTAQDTIFITVDGDYTVTLDVDASVKALTLGTSSGTQYLVISGNTLTVDSAATVLNTGRLELGAGGSLAGTGIIINEGAFDWTGGTLTGTGAFANTGAINISGNFPDTKAWSQRIIQNTGTTTWSGSATIFASDGATFLNSGGGSVVVNATGSIEDQQAGAPAVFLNLGAFSKSTSGTAALDIEFNSTGSVTVFGGTLALNAGGSYTGTFTVQSGGTLFFGLGTHTLEAGSGVTGGGNVTFGGGAYEAAGTFNITGLTSIGGPVTFNADATMFDLIITGGLLTGPATVTVNNSFSWIGGTLGGSGITRVGTGATMDISGSSTKFLDGRTIENAGTTQWALGNITASNGGTFFNQPTGTFAMNTNSTFGGVGTFQNQGAFTKVDPGIGQIGVAIDNTGIFDVLGGILVILGDFTNGNLATIQGLGTIDLQNAGTVTLNGDINPGTSPGVLSFIGSPPLQPNTRLNIELDGLTPGTEHDQIAVSGNLTIDGALNITRGFTPVVDDAFTVLTFGSRTGTFSSISGANIGAGLVLDTVWSATRLDLVVVQPPPAEVLFAGDSAGGLATGVFTADPGGANVAHLDTTTSLGRNFINPRWSPSRSRLAFTFGESFPVTPNELIIKSAAGDELAKAVTDTSAFFPRWSPDGVHMAYVCGNSPYGFSDLCVIPNVTGAISTLGNIGNAPGAGGTRVVVSDNTPADWADGPGFFAWDPLDPDRILFARDSSDGVNPGVSTFFTAQFDGTNVQRLAPNLILTRPSDGAQLLAVGSMDWWSDGSQNLIAFAGVDPQGDSDIYIINGDGTGLRQLTSGVGYDDTPIIRPDGVDVLFGRDLSCSYDGWLIGADGSNERQFTDHAICDFNYEYFGADWSPDGSEIVLTGFDVNFDNLLIYKVPNTVTVSDYRNVRVLIGRTPAAPFEIIDIQPSWRP